MKLPLQRSSSSPAVLEQHGGLWGQQEVPLPSPSLSSKVLCTVWQVEPSPWHTPQRSSTACESIS